jgi:hypothetical protein
MPANGGAAIQVTRDGGFAPVESEDGKFVYYTQELYNTQLWRIPVEGGLPTRCIGSMAGYQNLAITNNEAYFVLPRKAASGFSIQSLSFATNKIRPLADIEKLLSLGPMGGLDVSPDGRWILYSQVDQANTELMLVDNFH